ncbi:hypothetical protein LTR17_016635 [Elasticomyces elasticus]|nr:hypothetical protein LTR17_016635 [Elasticomyces elasticus]
MRCLSETRDVEHLLSSLTAEEKVALLSGADEWQTQGIERLGIGPLKVRHILSPRNGPSGNPAQPCTETAKITDGPAGARGKLLVDGPQAAFLPAPILQAATWCKEDLRAIGQLLCKETKTKAAQILAGPTMCCVRNPLGGRNFESLSEDPFLSGSLAIEYVKGLQESGEVVATAKHLCVSSNEQETERFSINATIGEQALREIYLRPFEMLIKSSTPPACIMTAYNKVNGSHMDMNSTILKDILRNEWKFDGLVMSDWGGTISTTESIVAGCDLEMPGPPVRRGQKLLEALDVDADGALTSAVDDSCRRVLALAKRVNLLGLSPAQVRASRNRPETTATSAADLRTLRKIVGEGHVLLKNSAATLPLTRNKLEGKSVAFIGPSALKCTPGGGGSATMNPQYQSHPFEAFKSMTSELGMDTEVFHATGVYSNKWLPLTSAEQWSASLAPSPQASMFKIVFFADGDLSGPIVATQYRDSSSIDLTDSGPASLRESGDPYSLRVTSYLRPTSTGNHCVSITSVGHARMFVDGDLVINNCDWTERGEAFYAFSSIEACATVHMIKDRVYEIVIEAASNVPAKSPDSEPAHVWSMQPSVRLGYLEQLPSDMVSVAVDLANKCNYTILVVGLSDEWESEGYDRQTLSLPPGQDELVQTLLDNAAKPENVIIVNQSGAAVEMPWAAQAQNILQAWYGGQEAGNALADVLLSLTSPSGRLPITWPKRYTDLHFAKRSAAWPGRDGSVIYEEGTDVGYRWFLKNKVEPQWWFGHGLTYTSFRYTTVEISHLDQQTWRITVDVANIGLMPGREVVQVYTWPEDEPDAKELRSFEKTKALEPGACQTVCLKVCMRDMAHWIEGRWTLVAGRYSSGLSKSAGDVGTVAMSVDVKERKTWEY